MQQVDDPPYLTVGTEVSAKYKGAFCEAKVRKVVRNIKCKVAYKQQGLGSGVVSDDQIKGALRVGAMVEVKHPERKEYVEATLTKIQDCSQYTVVFDDGDITTLRRSALCLKSGRHFNESETLDQLPLTHPEHFGNPVIGGRRGRRSRHLLADDSSDEDDEPATHSRSNTSDKEENIGKVVCVETSDNKKKNPKENWFPGLVVAPTAQDTVRIRVKDEYLVRSFKDGRYYTVPKKEASEFTRDSVNKSEATAVSAAIEYMDNDVLPPHWDREALFGMAGSCSDSDQELETDSSDDEPTEEKDHFVAQLYKFMDDRGTPLNKVPSIINRDVNLYRLFRAVQKLHGYNRVTSQNQWKQIALRLGFSPATASITNLVKQAYKKFLFSFEEFNRKLGCTMVPHPKTSRSKGRSLVRASSVQSPKLAEKEKLLTAKERAAAAAATILAANSSTSSAAAAAAADATNSAVEESGNTSESSAAESPALRPIKSKRKVAGGKVKALVDKFEEKEKDKEKEKTSTASLKIATSAADSSGSGGGGGGKKEDTTPANTAAPASAKKDKIVGKAKPPETIERRGRKRKDADSVDSKKDDRDSSTGIGGGTGSTVGGASLKQDKQSSQGSGGSGGGPHGSGSGSSCGGSGDGMSSGNGPGPGAGGGRRSSVHPGSATGMVPDFPIVVGDKLKVYYDEQKITYEAKVIEIANQEGNPIYLVHYTGWNTRYDEWVRKERIAVNLTNSKTKKGKSANNTSGSGVVGGGANKTSSNPGGAPPGAGDKTPKSSRRNRNSRGDGPGGPAATPRSTTPNVGRTKSPANPSNRRPLTRGGSSAVTGPNSLSASASNVGRRTSNNTDISSSLSVPTDPDNTSDTDSDEPMMKKCTTNSSSSTTSSNSSISMSSTSTKVSTTAEAGSSSDAAAISDEFSNGATKGGGGGGGGRDYDLNQIRSELKGFKELKTPGSPVSDTAPTTTSNAAGESSTSTTNPSDIPKHIILKREPTIKPTDSSFHTGESKSTSTITVAKKEHVPMTVKEEESTVTEEDEEQEKSSESESLSEEDSSQSSNKAFSSSPITTMVDSDTAETPLAAAIVSSPKVSPETREEGGVGTVELDDSSSTEPLMPVSCRNAEVEKGSVGNKMEPIEASEKDEKQPTSPLVGKPPIKTYGTAATIIANSEKMAFCTLRDVTADGDVKPPTVNTAQKDPAMETPIKNLPNPSLAVPESTTPPQQGWVVKRELSEEKVSPTTTSNTASRTTVSSTPEKTFSATTGIKEEAISPMPSVITSAGTGTKAIKSPKSPTTTLPPTKENAIVSVISKGTSSVLTSNTNIAPPSSTSASLVATSSISSQAASTSLAALRAEKKQSNASGPGAAPLGGEKKISIGREGTSAFSSTTAIVSSLSSSLPGLPAASLKLGSAAGGGHLGEKKHFSSSTLTPAQNKLLSKEALSIKSIFESTTNRLDEKISDVYEFEDEYDDKESGGVAGPGGAGVSSGGATGTPRKLVSDVPPSEVVSSLTAPIISSGTSASVGVLVEDKRKKATQRKSADPLDTSNVGGGYGGAKRTKKISPMKAEGVESKSVKSTGTRRETLAKEKDEQLKDKLTPVGDSGADTVTKPSSSTSVPIEKPSTKANQPSSASAEVSNVGLTTIPLATPIKSDSTFDVLRKSPSFNLVTPGQPGSKEEGSKTMDECDMKTTPPPPVLTTATTPGIFTPVISTSSAGSASAGNDRSSSVLHTTGHAGPSSSVLLAIAGDDKMKEEPTLENCKKYFNDMNFEFDAPTVKKPPSIADKVLKAISQQQQQHAQAQQQLVKSEKLEFPKYMPSPMHQHPNKLSTTVSSSIPSVSSSGGIEGSSTSSVSAIGAAQSTLKTELSTSDSSTTASYTTLKQFAGAHEPPHPEKSVESTVATVKKEPEEAHLKLATKPSPIGGETKSNVSGNNAPHQLASSQILLQSGHKHLLEHIAPARSNDLTESIRKLDPDPRFIHDDESTDSNDSEHRLIIEDAESQGSGDPVGMAPVVAVVSLAAVPSAPVVATNTSVSGLSVPIATSGTAAVIVHYDGRQQPPSSSSSAVVTAKKELFEDKPRSAASIAHEIASAASAAAVAAVAEKEKIVLKQERSSELTSSPPAKEESVKTVIAAQPTTTTTAVPVEKKGTGGSAKQSLLETIIQMNLAPRGLGSEDLMLKVNEQRRNAELMESRKEQRESIPEQSTTVITSTAMNESSTTAPTPPQTLDDKSQVPSLSQQAANNESLSLLLCEETIPGSPAPKDHDRLQPSTVGRKVYAEPPLASSFLPPQNIQTATDLKQVPMDLEPPVVTITIGGNTTISSSSSNQGAGGGGFGGGQHSSLQQHSGRISVGGSVSGKIGFGGGESAVDTPNSSPRDSVSQDETHDQESSPNKKRRQRKPSEEPTLKRRRTANTNLQGGYSSTNNGSSSGYGRSQRGMTTNNATDSEDNSDTVAAFHRSACSSMMVPSVGKSGRPCQYNFLVNLDPAFNNNQRIAILKKKIQELRKTYNAIKAELASIDRRRKKLRRRERENKKQAKLNSANASNN